MNRKILHIFLTLLAICIPNEYSQAKKIDRIGVEKYLKHFETQYGRNSNEYLRAVLSLEDLCISVNASLYPYIAHTVVENENTIQNTFGVDSPEYCKAMTTLDRLLYGQYLNECDFYSYSNEVHKVILNLEHKIKNTHKNRKEFLRIVSAVYVEDIANPEKALTFSRQLFDIVNHVAEPLLSEDYKNGVGLMIGAYELAQNESLYLEWIKDYFENLKLHNGVETVTKGNGLSRLQSALLVFLGEVSPEKYHLVRDYLFSILKDEGLGPEYIQSELRNWAYNEDYTTLRSYENIVMAHSNDKSQHAFYNELVAEGLTNLAEGAFQKSLPYYEKSWSLTHPSLRLITAWDYIQSFMELSIVEAVDYWANLMMNYFMSHVDEFGHESADESYTNILALHYLSNLLCDKGRYSEAISIEEKVLKTYDIYLESVPELHSTAYCNLGDYYSYIHNYSAGIELLKKALDLCPEENGIDRFTIWHNIAHCHSGLNNYDDAIKTELEALQILKRSSNFDGPTYYTSLAYLADYYAEAKRYKEAEQYFDEAIKHAEEFSGTNNPYYATLLCKMSNLYFETDIWKSIELLTKAKHIFEELYGSGHPFVIEVTSQLAMQYYFSGDNMSAIPLVEEVDHSIYNYLNNSFYYLTSLEQKSFWETQSLWFKNLLPQVILAEEKLYPTGYNFCLYTKGILLHCEQEIQQFVTTTDSSKLKAIYDELKALRRKRDNIISLPLTERSTTISELEKDINTLNRDLLIESKKIGGFTLNFNLTYEDVKACLKEDECALEFTTFPTRDGNEIYGVFILTQNLVKPNFVKLFSERDIEGLHNEDLYSDKKISKLIWGKLAPYLVGVENIYFAPDGKLHQIAIENFPDYDGEGIISDRWNLYRLSSTREIALNRPRESSREAVIYGGIRYDTDVTTMEEQSHNHNHTKNRGCNPYYNLGDSITLRGSLEYLRGSLIEAENIDGLMKEKEYNSTFLSGNDATEESFKNLSGRANGIIHISTHGFYWSEDKAEGKARLNNRLIFMSQLENGIRWNEEDKALSRSGLFMAGAKNTLAGITLPEDVDDGLLTAQEIANLDLHGLDLIVLSACQTGMGDINSDGVFGLQRGFKKAGANTILMSLWDVNDEATQILMTEFYKNYLNGQSKRQSLLSAQKAVRETPGFEDTEYWAAFILLDALN